MMPSAAYATVLGEQNKALAGEGVERSKPEPGLELRPSRKPGAVQSWGSSQADSQGQAVLRAGVSYDLLAGAEIGSA